MIQISHVSRYSEAVEHLMITTLRLFYQDHYVRTGRATLNPMEERISPGDGDALWPVFIHTQSHTVRYTELYPTSK